jgi:hypothetical protein
MTQTGVKNITWVKADTNFPDPLKPQAILRLSEIRVPTLVMLVLWNILIF